MSAGARSRVLGYWRNGPIVHHCAASRLRAREKGFLRILGCEEPWILKAYLDTSATSTVDAEPKVGQDSGLWVNEGGRASRTGPRPCLSRTRPSKLIISGISFAICGTGGLARSTVGLLSGKRLRRDRAQPVLVSWGLAW